MTLTRRIDVVADYGADPTGTNDSTAAITAALDAANSQSGAVWFPHGTYKCGQITKTYAPRIYGDGATIRVTTTNGWAWQFQGSAGGTTTLTANVAAGSKTLTVSNAGALTGGGSITVGDLVLVTDNTVVYDPQYSPGQAGYNRYHGQMVRVAALAGNTLTAEEPVEMLIQSGQGGYVQKINPIQDVVIDGMDFTVPTPGTTTVGFVRIDYAYRTQLDVSGTNATAAGFYLRSCYDFTIRARVRDFVYNSGAGQYAYGVLCSAACAHGVAEVYCHDGANAFTTSGEDNWHGEPVHIQVTGLNSGSSTGGFTCHPSGRNIEFVDCHVVGAAGDAFELRCPGASISGGRVEWCGASAVRIQDAGADCTIRGLRVRNVSGTAVYCSDANGMSGLRIIGCDFAEVAYNGVDFLAGATDVIVKGNTWRNVGTAGQAGQNRVILAESASKPLTRVRIDDNTILSTATNKPPYVLGANTSLTHVACSLTNNTVHNGIALLNGTLTGVAAPTTGAGANYLTAN